MENDSLNIALLTCDWRDDFRQSFSDFTDKLKRDHLEPDKNNFLVLAWTRAKSYHQKRSQFFTIHLSVSRIVVKPLLDFLSVFVYPWQVYRSGYKPDVVVVYDFGLAPAAWVTKICCGGKVALYCNHMPRMCARVRTMGRIKWLYAILQKRYLGVSLIIFLLSMKL